MLGFPNRCRTHSNCKLAKDESKVEIDIDWQYCENLAHFGDSDSLLCCEAEQEDEKND